MSEPKNKNYRDTLNLPQTAFPMKADLVHKEPGVLKQWEEADLYHALLRKNQGRPKFILHDGPPYANGSIHFGHILNKVLKDIIVRYKNMTGFQGPFVPGWDCHGLPIEHQVDKDLGPKKRSMSKLEIRKACREYARKYVALQKEEFKKLGVMGEWDHPYLTMNFDYEATIARQFGKFVREGAIYKGLRPVLWCSHCQTALAEAEIEYEEHESPSIYVRFPMEGDLGGLFPNLKDKKVSVVIWTTTPWTLPANLAVALHENYDYVVVPFQEEYLIVAKQLLRPFSEILGMAEPEPVYRFAGKKLENLLCRHPFLDRTSRLVLSDHVNIDTGTGCVHIAPGHGEEDYDVGKRYRLATLTPVDGEGRFTEEAGLEELKGLKVLQANPVIIEKLKAVGALLRHETIKHMYPHCWRCKNPLIFRATEQWFLSLEKNNLRASALDAVRRVHWIPSWGRERIYGMIEKRPDWCLSRQRSWGVPIIAFKCSRCNFVLLDPEIIDHVAKRFEKEGADVWFRESSDQLLPRKYDCPQCSEGKNQMGGSRGESGISPRFERGSGFASPSESTEWLKEESILDVWFDSGVSFAAVLEADPSLQSPADLYLEGSDQHRGWFHSSLLTSVGTRQKAPYKAVLTHGFVVDGEGKKYSKSAKNYVPPAQILQQYGAEILRLWVAAEDYRTDIRFSTEIVARLAEAYRKIRNTVRFLLGNLADFDPRQKDFSFEPIDLWALHHLQKITLRIREAYEGFEFHTIFHELNRYCTVDLSAFYLDILKDRLYTFAKNSPQRRAAQKVLFEIVTVLSRLMAPILSFTAEEIWQFIPAFHGKSPSVHLADFPEADSAFLNEPLAHRFEKFMAVRGEVLKVLEGARQKKLLGQSLEAKLTLLAEGEALEAVAGFRDSLPDLFQVSQVEWTDDLQEDPSTYRSTQFPALGIKVARADGKKCDRCWRWSQEVGKFARHPTVCERCYEVLQ